MKAKEKKIPKWAAWFLLLPPCFWTLGLYPVDIARALVFISLLAFLVPRWRSYLFSPLQLSIWQQRTLLACLFLYPFLMSSQHMIRLYSKPFSFDTN